MAIKKQSARQVSKRKPSSASKGKMSQLSQRRPSPTSGRKASQASTRNPIPKRASSTRKKINPTRGTRSRASIVTMDTLDALNERFDMMLPEVMFRIAALEHLLVKNQLCSYDELINARQYIQEQESS